MSEIQSQATAALASDRQQNLKHPFTPQLELQLQLTDPVPARPRAVPAEQHSSRAAAPHAYKLPATALSLHHSTSIGTLALHRLPPDAPVNIVLVLVLVLITLPTYSTPRPLLAPFCQLLVHFTTPTGKHAVHGPAHLIANLSRHGSASHPSAIPLPLFFFLPGSGAPSLPPCTSSLGSGR
ncbi:hypothetical protein L1887_48582 [Cichorium endivia]|nr:hypothetical protein L1887_48582 [Cichorium endivia]